MGKLLKYKPTFKRIYYHKLANIKGTTIESFEHIKICIYRWLYTRDHEEKKKLAWITLLINNNKSY